MSNTNYPPGPPMGQPYYQQPAPPPPAKKKRGWVKTGAIATGTFIFGLIIGSCGGGDNAANNAPYVEPTTVASQEPGAPAAPAPAPTSKAPEVVTVPLGQKGAVGPVSVTVKKVDCNRDSWTDGSGFGSAKTAPAGHKLCVIDTEVVNTSSSPTQLYGMQAQLADTSGNVYAWDSSTYLDYGAEHELNPTAKTAHDFVVPLPTGQSPATLDVKLGYDGTPTVFALK